MIDGDAFITPHAVEQFRTRIAPIPFERARAIIINELRCHTVSLKPLNSGVGLLARTRGGNWCFRAVIRPAGPGLKPSVVTILKSGK